MEEEEEVEEEEEEEEDSESDEDVLDGAMLIQRDARLLRLELLKHL